MDIPISSVPRGGKFRDGVTCSDCGLRAMCLPYGLNRQDGESFERCVRRRRRLQRGEMLYVAGRRAHAVYALRCGSIKTFAVDPAGEEVVQAFYLPGEVLGLEALAGDLHDHFAVALEPTLYCEIPASALAELVPRLPPLQRQLMRIVNRQLGESRRQSFIYGRREARLRLAAFLLELARRRAARRLSSTRFRLSMDRRDIANYLGLTLETVSRGFSRLQSEGLIESRGKAITLLQPRLLATLCGLGDPESMS